MDSKVEKFLLRHRPYCEFPDESGAPICMNRATHVITLEGARFRYQVAVCDSCFTYACTHKKIKNEQQR